MLKDTVLCVYLVHIRGCHNVDRKEMVFEEIIGAKIGESIGICDGCLVLSMTSDGVRQVRYIGSSH